MTTARFCPTCGAARAGDGRFCGGCGADYATVAIDVSGSRGRRARRLRRWAPVALIIAIATVFVAGGLLISSGRVALPWADSAAGPAVDEAKVAALIAQLQSDPSNAETMLAIANEYYAASQYATAGTWLDMVLAIEPENIKALIARGAVSFNTGKDVEAEATWRKVLEIDPANQEAHFDLGFLYFSKVNPDWTAVQREWNKVIELDPTTQFAQMAKAHLDELVAKSMIP